ncbi:phosphotransferase [Nonomuraea sp. NPDC052116]|uniref:phosphotransferase n=1 Tax=Nonomuraea sp. NPDC052116 TaxID=3155665 RepID=UPI00343DF71F
MLWLHGDLHPVNVPTVDGTVCGVIDFGDLFARDPAGNLAAAWNLLPDGTADLFHAAYRPALDAAALRRARGWAVRRALGGSLIGEAGVRGRPGGKATSGPPAHAALRRLGVTPSRPATRATASGQRPCELERLPSRPCPRRVGAGGPSTRSLPDRRSTASSERRS